MLLLWCLQTQCETSYKCEQNRNTKSVASRLQITPRNLPETKNELYHLAESLCMRSWQTPHKVIRQNWTRRNLHLPNLAQWFFRFHIHKKCKYLCRFGDWQRERERDREIENSDWNTGLTVNDLLTLLPLYLYVVQVDKNMCVQNTVSLSRDAA